MTKQSRSHRAELAQFVRNARNRLNPKDFGITPTGTRRTPGLRREEIALLAGISPTWYTWFEQGRDIQLSSDVLDRISVVLQLNNKEREFLFLLAQGRPPPPAPTQEEAVSEGARLLLETIGLPALVMNEVWTVIGWNELVSRLFRDYGEMPETERNLFRILLLSERYQEDPEEYEQLVARLTARLKWDYSRAKDRSYFDQMIEEARSLSPLFDRYWRGNDIADVFEASHSVTIEGVGRIDLHHTSYAVEGASGQRLLVFSPENEASRARLAKVNALIAKSQKAADRSSN